MKELAFGSPNPPKVGTWTRQAGSNQEKECRNDVGVEVEPLLKDHLDEVEVEHLH